MDREIDSPVRDPLRQKAAEDGADAVGQPEGRQGQAVGRRAPLLLLFGWLVVVCVLVDRVI